MAIIASNNDLQHPTAILTHMSVDGHGKVDDLVQKIAKKTSKLVYVLPNSTIKSWEQEVSTKMTT